MLTKIRNYAAAHPVAVLAGGVLVGLAVATTVMGARATSKIAALRTKAGI